MTTGTPPGWFDDGHGALRWWDGQAWTEHTHAVPPVSAPAAPGHDGRDIAAAPAPPRSRTGLWIGLGVGGGVLLLIVLALVVVFAAVLPGIRTVGDALGAPAEVVEAYNDAWYSGDCDAYVEVTTESLRDAYGVECTDFVGSSDLDTGFSVLSVEIENSDATVVYQLDGTMVEGGTYSDVYEATLVNEGGQWLVDSDVLIEEQ